MKICLVLNDFHVPYHDRHVLENIIYPVIKAIKPDTLVIAGDLLDCYGLSRFNKDPKRIDSFQEELDVAIPILAKIHKLAPTAKKVFLKGNHEERLTKTLQNTQMYASLEALRWPTLLNLKEHGFTFVENVYPLTKGFIIHHGCIIRKHAAYFVGF